jgi:hypothetical protein
MFIATLFTIAKLWKQPRCPTTDKWIKKMWYLNTWNFTQPWRRMKSYHSQVNGWNWRTSFWVRLARLRRPKNHMFSLICRLWSSAKVVMLLDLGHTLRGDHIQEELGNPKLERVWCAHCRGANIVTLEKRGHYGKMTRK